MWGRCNEEIRKCNDFWSNPIFDNVDLKRLYKSYLVRAGHCPVCGDFLFVDIERDMIYSEEYYKVTKYCISHECSYTEDISGEFNEKLGLTKVKVGGDGGRMVNSSYHYYALEIEHGFPKSTGCLKDSLNRNAFGVKDCCQR